MLQLAIDDKLDKTLELRLCWAEDQFQILLCVTMPLGETVFFEEPENVRASYMSLASPVDSLKQHYGREFLHKTHLEVEAQVQKVSLCLHQVLLCLD